MNLLKNLLWARVFFAPDDGGGDMGGGDGGGDSSAPAGGDERYFGDPNASPNDGGAAGGDGQPGEAAAAGGAAGPSAQELEEYRQYAEFMRSNGGIGAVKDAVSNYGLYNRRFEENEELRDVMVHIAKHGA